MNDERVEEIFARLAEINIELDYDPIERGPKFLNHMVAKCRNSTTEVQKYMRECQMFIRTIQRQLRTAEARFQIEYNELMANDPDIAKMRAHSRADREALANTKLREQIEEINQLELAVTDAGHVETVIDSKLRELRDVNRDIRLQKRLIEDEIETGAFWGTDQEGMTTEEHDVTDIEAADVADMFEQPDDEDVPKADDDSYEEFFVVGDQKELDNGDQTDMVVQRSAITDQQEALDAETAVFEEESFEDLDFDAALNSLG